MFELYNIMRNAKSFEPITARGMGLDNPNLTIKGIITT
jgi:hypothetical protein